eukprot:CAMPEP_0185200174 /NCGR_PEP_ID=MMETSP1140-20130426/46669_1 /TAXON_ID=298111 /ORGANISM="Pavlova sp., Strain CCMP459" /LENGTH=122 /DNA_ID=CAMNT_0027767485 /DNA_START=51 /DNA_END=417 /DNA_ORIENTATION=+
MSAALSRTARASVHANHGAHGVARYTDEAYTAPLPPLHEIIALRLRLSPHSGTMHRATIGARRRPRCGSAVPGGEIDGIAPLGAGGWARARAAARGALEQLQTAPPPRRDNDPAPARRGSPG